MAFTRFSLVGALGFALDTTIFLIVLHTFQTPFAARIVAFLCAVQLTYLLNRRWTFPTAPHRSPLLYGLAQSLGALLNLGSFTLIVWAWPRTPYNYYVGQLVGALVGLTFSYTINRKFVFAQ